MRTHIVISVMVVMFLFLAVLGVGGYGYVKWDQSERQKEKSLTQTKTNKAKESTKPKEPSAEMQAALDAERQRVKRERVIDGDERKIKQKEEPEPVAVQEKKKDDDKTESAADLVEKARQLIGERVKPEKGFSRAQAAVPNQKAALALLSKAASSCGPEKEDQTLKAKIHYRSALLQKDLKDKEETLSMMAFAKVMREQNIGQNEQAKIRRELWGDQNALIRKSYGLDAKGK